MNKVIMTNDQQGMLDQFFKKHRRLLHKVHKLKRENLVLSDRRKSILLRNLIKGEDMVELLIMSEKIGSNGLKIRHLRTKIQKLKSDYLRYDKVE